MSFGPADLAASRRMKTTRVGGGHPGYRSIEDPDAENPDPPRASAQQDPWHYSLARMVDACTSMGILPFYGPFGDIRDSVGLRGAVPGGLHPGLRRRVVAAPLQIAIAKRVFSPDPGEVAFARRVLEAIPDGAGVHMLDGKMQDDATWKQAKVMVDLAEMLAARTPSWRRAYGFRVLRPMPHLALRDTPSMRISAKADYAVRAVAELAKADGDKPVKAERVASAQGIPLNFLENILGELRHAGIVRSQRGAEGGFRLAKPAGEITVADVIRAVEGRSRASAAARRRTPSTAARPRRCRRYGSRCAPTCGASSSR